LFVAEKINLPPFPLLFLVHDADEHQALVLIAAQVVTEDAKPTCEGYKSSPVVRPNGRGRWV
jgi:hypothetical protein